MVLYLNKDSGRVEGVTYGSPTRAVHFTSFEANKSFLTFPTHRSTRIPAGNIQSEMLLDDLRVNDFVDEGLFEGKAASKNAR